jgi:hypothetical protein
MRSSITTRCTTTCITTCLAALAFAILAPLAAGCATAAGDATGTLEIPLQQAGSDGALYHLTASFQIDGPGGTQVLDGTGATPSLVVSLPAGIASVKMLDGWTLEKSADGGATFQPVSALLGTANPFPVRILANQPLSISYDFLIRDQTGALTISFSVSRAPRELAGGFFVETGTADFAPYAGKNFDFAIFYDLDDVQSFTQDAAKVRMFESTRFAMEFFNDPIGLLAGTVAPAVAGGFVEYQVAVQPDGTQVVGGALSSGNAPFTELQLGPHTMFNNLPLDADGFVVDQFFADSLVPITWTTSFDAGPATLTGHLNIRFIPSRAPAAN